MTMTLPRICRRFVIAALGMMVLAGFSSLGCAQSLPSKKIVLQVQPTRNAASHRPNVLIILADDLGWSDVGCYGSEISTPNIDALAAGGLRFTQFYNDARCSPSRASLLTGLYPHEAGRAGAGDSLE